MSLDNYQEVYRQTKLLKAKVEFLEDALLELSVKVKDLEKRPVEKKEYFK